MDFYEKTPFPKDPFFRTRELLQVTCFPKYFGNIFDLIEFTLTLFHSSTYTLEHFLNYMK